MVDLVEDVTNGDLVAEWVRRASKRSRFYKFRHHSRKLTKYTVFFLLLARKRHKDRRRRRRRRAEEASSSNRGFVVESPLSTRFERKISEKNT